MQSIARLRFYTDRALDAASYILGKPIELRQALYEMRVAFDSLHPPPKEFFPAANSEDAGLLADDLEALAAVPLDTESRGFAYVALDRLALYGCRRAFQVLQRCLAWESSSDLVEMASRTLAASPAHQDASSAKFIVLKSALYVSGWPTDRLASSDGIVRLVNETRRHTHLAIQNLSPQRRLLEHFAQVERVCRDRSIMELELVFRDAAETSGIIRLTSTLFRGGAVSGATAELGVREYLADALGLVIAKAMDCIDDDDRFRLWNIEFETVVFAALAAVGHFYPGSRAATEATSVFLRGLELPLDQDALRLAALPTRLRAGRAAGLARREIETRRMVLRALGEPPILVQSDGIAEISVYGSAARDKLHKYSHLLMQERSLVAAAGDELDEDDRAQDTVWLRQLLDRWSNVEIC